MTGRFWAWLEGSARGPFSIEELRGLAAFGPRLLLFPEGARGAESWAPAGVVPGLLPQEPRAGGLDVLVVDDDPGVRELVLTLLEGGGYAARAESSSERVVALARELRPRLIVLDVMMPGMDGVSACKALKRDPVAGASRVLVMSGRPETEERERVLRHGGDAFLGKPIDRRALLGVVEKLVGPPASEGGPSPRLTVVGAGGPRSGACLWLETSQDLVVLDAGAALARRRGDLASRESVTLLLTSCRPGHVEGLRAALEAAPRALFDIRAPDDPDLPLADFAARLIPPDRASRAKVAAAYEGPLSLGGAARARAIYSDAPGTSLLYRVELGGRAIAYCPNSEVPDPRSPKLGDFVAKLRELARGVDVLVHDARYAAGDFPGHVGEGHSSCEEAARLAAACGAKRLVLFGLDEAYGGSRAERLVEDCCLLAAEAGGDLEIGLVGDGESLSL